MTDTLVIDTPEKEKTSLTTITISWKTILFLLVVAAAILSRVYLLGERVMSHDEINHVYFAHNFFKGGEYVHNPITHGPLQFHLLELSYFLFGASDFTARIPSAFFSILTVLFIWKLKRYLGEAGAIIASILFIISPYMLYYGRYARNEAIAIFFTVATVWSVLRYLDNGKNKYLYLTAAFTALHLATKETAYIFIAELMLFLGILFIYRISKLAWEKPKFRNAFIIFLLITAVLLMGALALNFLPTLQPQNLENLPELGEAAINPETAPMNTPALVVIAAAALCFVSAFAVLVTGFGWKNLIQERAFGMLLFQLTLVLPQLAAFPAFWLKLPITDYSNIEAIRQISLLLVPFLIGSIILGGLWKPKTWLVAAGIFYGIFFLFYTSIFSNLGGIYSGLVGSLGYWLEQHGVERGSQPWYYFLLIQIPLYEYLALLGASLTGVYAFTRISGKRTNTEPNDLLMVNPDTQLLSRDNSKRLALAMLLFMSVASLIAYALVGEKMPWLTVHISWSMWLVTGWLVGKLINQFDFLSLRRSRSLGILFTAILGLISLVRTFTLLISTTPPFQGKELIQLESTGEFLLTLILAAGSIYAFLRLTGLWKSSRKWQFITLTVFLLLGVLTTRHAAMASYKNYDQANEYLVYAHAARGPKDALEQIESISLRITGGNEIMVAFDNHASYPFWWYLRDYPNRFEFFENPTRELRNYPIILVGDANYHLLDPIVQDDYVQFEYLRMIWPNQDYFDLSYYWNYLTNPETRTGMLNSLFQVWLNRDFTLYGQITGQDTSARHWNPSQSFKMYVRKDIASQVWQFGAIADAIAIEPDPYISGQIDLTPASTLTNLGLNGPKGLAVAPDGSLFVADTGNNRILHISQDMIVLNQWGTEGALPGEFNQPWGIAVDQDGFVYVADTWNHRVQKFSQTGEFVSTWGAYGQAETPEQFWGPRGIAVDPQGQVLITDTGNKRVVVFSNTGEYIGQFGSVGYQLGEFDEPVGITVSPIDGMVFIADTWNQRVQGFEVFNAINYLPALEWEIDGWYGQSLENKPFLTADYFNRVIVADPEAARILVFANDGTFLSTFGTFSEFGENGFGVISGVAADSVGGLWVADSLKNEIKYFVLP